MKQSGMNMVLIKHQNRVTVLQYLLKKGPVSRKDVADAVGLTPAALTSICTELMGEGIIREVGILERTSGLGRKKILIDINYDYAFLYGINIELESTVIVLSNLKGDVVARETISTRGDCAPETFLKEIADVCIRLRESQKPSLQKRIKGASIGIVGPVDRKRGSSLRAYGIWQQEVMVCDILSKALGVRAVIENNVDALARATILFGIGRQYDNLLIFKWGPGVGSTIVINGGIYEGRHGKAAELGHFIVDRNGKQCSCGRRGCLETKISVSALQEILDFEPSFFGEAYEKANADTQERIDEAIDLFARCMVNSMTILAPNRVVLSGALFRDSIIRDRLIEYCQKYDIGIDDKRILYNSIALQEDYIGTIASFLENIISG